MTLTKILKIVLEESIITYNNRLSAHTNIFWNSSHETIIDYHLG